jgi:hypothetical protein
VGVTTSTVAGHHLPVRSLQSNQSPSARLAMDQGGPVDAASLEEAPAPDAGEKMIRQEQTGVGRGGGEEMPSSLQGVC